MGKGIKAGRSKEIRHGKNFVLMEQAYRDGYGKGYCRGKDDYLGLSNLLFQTATAKEFGWGPEEFQILKDCIDQITSDANKRDVVELQRELQEFLESEDEMANKAKYTEAALIKGIEDGLDNNQIMDRLDTARGSRPTINSRLNKLRIKHGALEIRTKKEFDLKLYDTLTRYGKWYRVTEIGGNCFTVTNTGGQKNSEVITKEDYLSGKTAFIKRDLPEVKCYVDESLKNKPEEVKPTAEDVAAAINGNWGPAYGLKNTSDAPSPEAEAVESDIDPAYSFDKAVQVHTDFLRQAELSFKADMEIYLKHVSKIKGEMDRGEIVDLTDVSEYNRIADKYRGVM
ncbi:hypothetical protein [Aminipila luticellarii]|uniref:Uncharacterized protein n=1 Tax=Aminipila luticellarii TaxID=2507160 RepID=A0A410PWZ7_9FIRM|nr:hypothetical protein [Aminipila luticellarii]QAT43461.1 hypothetical protein EQM06_09665 [Aminipila luticellarii]